MSPRRRSNERKASGPRCVSHPGGRLYPYSRCQTAIPSRLALRRQTRFFVASARCLGRGSLSRFGFLLSTLFVSFPFLLPCLVSSLRLRVALHHARPRRGRRSAGGARVPREHPVVRAMTGTRGAHIEAPRHSATNVSPLARSTVAISASDNALPHAAFPSGSRRFSSRFPTPVGGAGLARDPCARVIVDPKDRCPTSRGGRKPDNRDSHSLAPPCKTPLEGTP
jgi:hypothetical protein